MKGSNHTDSGEKYYNLGVVYQQRGESEKALRAYQRALEVGFSYANMYINIGVIYYQSGELNWAIQSYLKGIEIDPHNAAAYNNLGNPYSKQGRLNEAIKSYQKAIFLSPDCDKAYYNLGRLYQQQEDLRGAIQAYHKAIQLNPNYTKAYYNLGVAYCQQGVVGETVPLNNNRDELSNDTQNSEMESGPSDAISYYNQGIAHYQQRAWEDAISAFQRALRIDPNHPDVKLKLESVYFDQGVAHYQQGEFKEGIRAFEKVNNNTDTHNYLKIGYSKQGQLDHKNGRFREAIQAFQHILNMEPSSDESITAYNYLRQSYIAQGNIYYQRGRFREAIWAFQHVLDIQPKDVDACNYLKEVYITQGGIYYREDKLDEALQLFQSAVELSLDDWKIHNSLGEVLKDQGKLNEAIHAFQRAVELSPKDARLYSNLGNVFKEQNNLEEAFKAYHFALTYAMQRQKEILQEKEEDRQILRSELDDARQMQLSLLPQSSPEIEGLQISGKSIPANEVGGDFLDYLVYDDTSKITVAVGDVSGKGLRGAMNAVMASAALRLVCKHEVNTSAAMSEVNASLCENMEQDMNVTMVLAEFNTSKKQMKLTNAGQHAYPLLIRDGRVEPVKAKGLALGMIPTITYKSSMVDLESGDLLLFMTDGITEPCDAEGIMYGESGKLDEMLSRIPTEILIEEVVDTIINDVEDYTADEEQDDDITLVAVRVI